MSTSHLDTNNVAAESTAIYPRCVRGQHFNTEFPVSVDSFIEQGTAFLNTAFHASGAIDADNKVAEITHIQEFVAGGMGRKLIVDITYSKPQADLHNRLFIKFPREFGDPLRETFSAVLGPEIQFALLSTQSGFPVAVPKCYFADFDPETGSSILITEAIAFGEGNIEPVHDKCLDYLLEDPLPYYEALSDALGCLAGAHKSGALGENIDQLFPFGEADKSAAIPYTAEILEQKLKKLCEFTSNYPQLFPTQLLSDNFIQTFAQQAPAVLAKQSHIFSVLNGSPDLIALCHWNANIDNAWFYRTVNGDLQAGLLDWGSAGQMNIAQGFYGLICAAEPEFLVKHKTHLIKHFLKAYKNNGGPAVEEAEFRFHLDLAMALLGIAWMIDAPSLVEQQVPDLYKATSRKDPLVKNDFLARAQLHLITVFLSTWKQDDLYSAICKLN